MGAGGVAIRFGWVFRRKLAGIGKGDPGDALGRAKFDKMLAGACCLHRRCREDEQGWTDQQETRALAGQAAARAGFILVAMTLFLRHATPFPQAAAIRSTQAAVGGIMERFAAFGDGKKPRYGVITASVPPATRYAASGQGGGRGDGRERRRKRQQQADHRHTGI